MEIMRINSGNNRETQESQTKDSKNPIKIVEWKATRWRYCCRQLFSLLVKLPF